MDLTPGRPARLLDLVHGRSGPVLAAWLGGQPEVWLTQITPAALDPFRGYATALAEKLPAATRVLDPFHVAKLGLDALDDVRRRVQQHTLGRRGHAGDPSTAVGGCCAAAPTTSPSGPGTSCASASLTTTSPGEVAVA